MHIRPVAIAVLTVLAHGVARYDIGGDRGEAVHYRTTAPVRRVGEAGTLGMLTATYWDYRDIMASAMAGKVRQYAVEGGSGQAEAFSSMSLISCH